MIKHLTDRPCAVCEFHKENGCSKWSCVFEQEPTTKNDLGVDLISRADVLQILLDYDYANENALVLKDIKKLPSVTLQPCEDAISRQALLNATVNKNSIWNKTTDSKGENLETIISKLPSVTPQEPRWILVSERLPDICNCSEKYLVTLKRGGVHIAMFTECNGKHWWTHNVVAWMPLPQPYKAESEE